VRIEQQRKNAFLKNASDSGKNTLCNRNFSGDYEKLLLENRDLRQEASEKKFEKIFAQGYKKKREKRD
jgi:hypothetical protein